MATLTRDTARIGASPGGLLLALLSASSFALSGPLARGLMDAGWSSAAAVTVRVLLGAAVLIPVALLQLRGRWSLLRRNLPVVTAYGLIAVAGCQLAYFNAVTHMPVGVALLIEYTAPVPVVVWMWMRHGQRPGRLTALGALAGAAGLLLVLDLVSGVERTWSGSAGRSARWRVRRSTSCCPRMTVTGCPAPCSPQAGCSSAPPPCCCAGLAGVVPMTVSTAPVAFDGVMLPWWLPVLALGVVTAAVSYVTGIAATRRLGSRLASFVALLEVLAALAFARLFLGQAPATVQLLGGALIIAGVVIVRRGEPGANKSAAVQQ